MAHDCAGVAATLTAQKLFFRLIEREHDDSQKMMALAEG